MKLHLPIALLAITIMPAISSAAEYPQITTVDGNTYVNVGTYSVGNLCGQESQKVYYEGDLNLDSGDKLGYIKDGKLQDQSKTNSLYVNGDVTISGDARVLLGGAQGGTYNQGGLVAKNVLIDSTATGSSGAGKASIWSEAFKAETLTVNGGYVNIGYKSDNGSFLGGYGQLASDAGAPPLDHG